MVDGLAEAMAGDRAGLAQGGGVFGGGGDADTDVVGKAAGGARLSEGAEHCSTGCAEKSGQRLAPFADSARWSGGWRGRGR